MTEPVYTLDEVLTLQGFDSPESAKAVNVAFICLQCGSIASVSADNERERVEQRDMIDYDCCGGWQTFI